MLCLLILALFDPAVANYDRTDGSYFISYSDTFQRGVPYSVSVDILNTTASVHVSTEINRIWNNNTGYYATTITREEGDFVMGKTGKLSLNIPNHLEAGSYRLHIRGSHGLQFEREDTINLNRKTMSVMIQTDKAIYKPGQIVHFRAFGVYSDLQLYTGKLDITLSDPNSNVLKLWMGLESSTGVVAGEFKLADKPLLGDWSIHVQAEEQAESHIKRFTVDEYQLPRFEVKVELPPFSLMSDNKLSGTVKATYTFGKPVKGMVELHAHLDTGNDGCGRPPQYVELAFPTDGDTKFSMPVADLRRLTYNLEEKKIVMVAIVKEDLTGARMNGSSSVTFYQHPYKIDVLSSSPKTFSPKLPYTAYVQVTQQDGRPVSDLSSPLSVYPLVHYRMVRDDQDMYSCSTFSGSFGLPPKNYTIPASGIVPIDIRIPENTTSVDVKFHYKDITGTLTVNKKSSNSDNYLQVRLSNKGLMSGQTASFTVAHTENMPFLTYEILSRGSVTATERVPLSGQQQVTFNVPVTTSMAPVAHVIVYYVRDTGEVVADSLAFSVDQFFDNQVSIAFSRNQSQPHENIDVIVTADPQSNVNLLAVDQSVLLLKSGNDITTDQVLGELRSYDNGVTSGDFSPEVFSISSSSENAQSVFSDAGLSVITDAKYFDERTYSHYMTTPAPGMLPTFGGRPSGQGLKEVERVRKIFPETWLWMNQTVGSTGKAVINTTVPDTITSWVASAFAVNPSSGLGVAPTTSKLQVFRSFFVSVSMPTSVIRGEQVIVQASVFNYLASDVDVVVSLPTSSDYANVVVDNMGKTTQENKDQTKMITVKSNEPITVYFPIIPSSLGPVDVQVSARSTLSADAVRRQLLVLPEGIPKEYSNQIFVELTPGGADFTQKLALTLPPEAVKGSENVKVKVTGDLIGASLDSLEHLLSLPTGCGEQNMMSFAPDVYIAEYLTATKQMTPALEAKITDFLELGYQRELTYQRNDGSFSPFGERDEAGSMWLTAFVTRVFHQARPYIFVGDKTLIRSLRWMASRQNLDGSFNEPGLVLDKQMQRSKASLTAMVLMAFLENSDMVGDTYGQLNSYVYGNATVNATNYLEKVAPSLADSFSLAVVSLALTKAKSLVSGTPYSKLTAASHIKGNMQYWTEPATTTPNYYTTWTPPHVRAQPINIQTTAYALMATAARGDLKSCLPIANWLSAQRNPYGGFSTTQDTIVALQALSDYAARTHVSGLHVDLDFKAGSDDLHLSVDDKNALALQSRELSAFPSDVTVTATGKGVAYAEVDVFFNVDSEIGDPAFDINTVLLDDTLNNFRLMTCTKWLKADTSGMAVMEISIPTGFEPDMTSIGDVAGLKRIEKRGRNAVVYFDEIGATSICFDLLSTRTGMVTNNQQSYVTVYDYYQPDNQASVFYEPRSLKTATICDVCEKCCPQP